MIRRHIFNAIMNAMESPWQYEEIAMRIEFGDGWTLSLVKEDNILKAFGEDANGEPFLFQFTLDMLREHDELTLTYHLLGEEI